MSKYVRTYSAICFILIIAIDLIIKSHYVELNNFHHNNGFIFGSFHELPASVTLVSLTSIGALLIFLFVALIWLLSNELVTLKVGLAAIAGGVLGNVIDRAWHGGTTDFIPFIFNNKIWLYYNPADVFQWIGAGLILFNIFKNDQVIWFPMNQRGMGLVNPKEQLIFALKLLLVSGCTSLVLGIFSMAFLTFILKSANLYSTNTMIAFVLGFVSISVLFSILAFLFGMILSNRTIGPLYAFEKYVEVLLNGERRDFKLRAGDNLQHLQEVASSLRIYFEKNDSDDKK